MLRAALEVLIAYVLVDLATGVYHWLTDKGFNLHHQVCQFREHHDTNSMVGFDWQPMLIGVPAMLLGLWLESAWLLAAGSFGVLAQVPHYYAHRRSQYQAVHRVIRLLQRTCVILSPQAHAEHHDGRFERNFCILSGWNNWWLNLLVAPRSECPP